MSRIPKLQPFFNREMDVPPHRRAEGRLESLEDLIYKLPGGILDILAGLEVRTEEAPDPTPSPRRLENRVATLEEEVKRLASRVEANHKWSFDHSHLPNGLAVIGYTPDQPAAPRIDPDDEGQIEVVAEAIYNSRTSTYDKVKARYILDALDSYLNGPANG